MSASEKPALTHFDESGQAHMVDVGEKPLTRRMATATGLIRMQAETLRLVESGTARKGDVLGVARVAAIQGAKRTSELIPLCHPIGLNKVSVDLSIEATTSAVRCTVTTECFGATGVEMEALTAVQVGLLTVYDMLKAVDRGMTIEGVMLLRKEGGRSGSFSRSLAS